MGAYSRWALIRGGRLFEVGSYSRWALNRINTVIEYDIENENGFQASDVSKALALLVGLR